MGPTCNQTVAEHLETITQLREIDRIPGPVGIDHDEALFGVGEQEP
jgi:hypothetical protein